MANRRQFLAVSLAGSALISAYSVRAGAVLTDSAHKTLSGFVFDERFAQAALLARDLKPLGVRAFAIQEDVSDVWYEQLSPALQAGAQTIGGLTSAGGLFVLNRLGFDAGLSLALHGTHQFADDRDEAQHALDASPSAKLGFNAALESGLSWTAALQVAFTEAAFRPPVDRIDFADISANETAQQTVLHSWILMPRR